MIIIILRTNEVQLSRRDGGRNTLLSYRYSQRSFLVLAGRLCHPHHHHPHRHDDPINMIRDTMVYYWSLPRQFLGNKLGAYGGNLTFYQVTGQVT